MFQMTMSDGSSSMDIFGFLSSVIGSVAWPLAAIAIALALKDQLSALIAGLEEATFGGNTVKFRKKVHDAEDRLANLEDQPLVFAAAVNGSAAAGPARAYDGASDAQEPGKAEPTMAFDQMPNDLKDQAEEFAEKSKLREVENLVKSSPPDAVLGAWKLIELSVRKAAARYQISFDGIGIGPLQLGLLNQKGILTKEMSSVLADLLRLRNEAYNGVKVDANSAYAYLRATSRLLDLLRAMRHFSGQ